VIKKYSIIKVEHQVNSLIQPFLYLIKFKRIQRYEYNISSETWKYLLEDRTVENEVNLVACDMINLFNSFMQFDNYDNKEFCQLLKKVHNVFCFMHCKINSLSEQGLMIEKPMGSNEF